MTQLKITMRHPVDLKASHILTDGNTGIGKDERTKRNKPDFLHIKVDDITSRKPRIRQYTA